MTREVIAFNLQDEASDIDYDREAGVLYISFGKPHQRTTVKESTA